MDRSNLPTTFRLFFAAITLMFTVQAHAQSAVPPLDVFEIPPTFRASEILTSEQLAGPYHKVREEVATDGVTNTYVIDSDFGVFVANGNDMLPERIREIYAIAAIRETKESDAYGKALAGAAKGTVEGAKNLVKDPVGSISGMGKGAMRFMRGATERVCTMSDDSDTADSMRQFSDARRQIAAHYGVDPYTSNEVLLKEINDLAGAAKLGNLTFSLVTIALPAKGLGAVTKGVSASANLNAMLLEKGPYTLRTENRDRLRAMALDDYVIDSFLNHPTLNPKHQTAITLALEKMAGARSRGTFLRLAMASQSEEDARFFSYGAALMAQYHATRSPVIEIVDFHGMPACYTTEKRLVLPILLDYGSWSDVGARFAGLFLEHTLSETPIEGREWVLTGSLSPRAKAELEKRAFVVTENAFTSLATN